MGYQIKSFHKVFPLKVFHYVHIESYSKSLVSVVLSNGASVVRCDEDVDGGGGVGVVDLAREEWSEETVTRWHWGTVDWHGTLQGNNMNVRWFLCVRICNTFSSYDPNLD